MRIPDLSNIGFRVRRGDEILMYLLGLFSTWQILQFAGFSLSTLLTVLTAGYLIFSRGFSYFRKDWLLIAIALSTFTTLGVSLLAELPSGYVKVSISGTLQWVLIFLICIYMHRSNNSHCTGSFFQGLDLSCKVQIIWCLLQMVTYYALDLDINAKLFGELLHTNNETSQYRNGVLACTGLHWHAANMIPILAYLYFRYPGLLWKGLCFVVVYFMKNATAIIAASLCIGLDAMRFCWRVLRSPESSIPKRIAAYIMVGISCVCVIAPFVFPKIWEMLEYLLLRFSQISNPSYGNESSAVHFNYYRHLPYILGNISPFEVLFGSGFNTSGYRFSYFFDQYSQSIWTVESDLVNITLGKGVIGCILHYSFLILLAIRLKKTKQTNHICFLLVLLLCGFVYDNQFIWVLLTEFMMYCTTFYPKNAKENYQ